MSLSHLVESVLNNQHAAISPKLPVVEDDDNLSDWVAVGDGLLTPTTIEMDWSIIDGGALTPIYSDNASVMSFASEHPIDIWSSGLPCDTQLDIALKNSTTSRKWRCDLCKPK